MSSEQISFDMLMTEMRIINARIEMMESHCRAIKKISDNLEWQSESLKSQKRDIQARFDHLVRKGGQ